MDDMRDEVPVPHFEDELWPTLARAHADQRGAGAPSPSPPGVAEARARRRAHRMVLAGVGSIAAAAVAVAAVVVTGSGDAPDGGSDAETAATTPSTTPSTAAPEMSLAAQITAATEEASESSIVHTRWDNQYDADDGTPIGDEESWTDEQSGARRNLSYDSEGEPSFDTGRATPPDVDDPGPPPIPPDAEPFDPSLPQERLRHVDYCFSEYVEDDQTAIPGINEAESIGEMLEEGALVEDGTEVVDGRELIRLVEVPVGLQPPSDEDRGETWLGGDATTTAPVAAPEPGELDPDTFEYVEHIYLVDAETLRPVRMIGFPGEAPDYSDAMYVATIEYLPRTPENMALLSAPAPEGFTLVADLRGDGERLDQCGW